MSAPTPRFAVLDLAPGEGTGAGFAQAVIGRVHARHAVWWLSFLIVLQTNSVVWLYGRFVIPTTTWMAHLLIDSLGIAIIILAVLFADEAVALGARRWLAYLTALFVACVIAAWAPRELCAWLGWQTFLSTSPPLVRETEPWRLFLSFMLYGGMAIPVYVNRRTARLAADRLRVAELARAQSRRRTLESRLQALQARVEPQFLFNTLAQVRELYERDPALAARLLDDLIAYLRAALPHLRESSSTLGQEVALAQAYLDIMRVRLGERLAFEIDVPEAVKGARMPPMMLLPLIDHALVYGLQPGDAQGKIRITTRAEQGRLQLAITDSGVAFVPDGQAKDLAAIGERLRALYGDDARFELERIVERGNMRGTRAILEIPYEDSTGSTDRGDR